MAIFGRDTIFHTEESTTDPDELKLRFRRRILSLAVLGFLFLLGAPVLRDILESLKARHQARLLADKIVSSRYLSASHRRPVTLKLNRETKTWVRSSLSSENPTSCGSEAYGPEEVWPAGDYVWELKEQKGDKEIVEGHYLCFHPQLGLLLDDTPLGEGQLLVTVKPNDSSIQAQAHVLISQFGSEVQLLAH